ncbi:Alpha-Mannosidase 2X [Manis pentadactyla]|nr:Alpha-Mannosidase 2X [Manis pentadactyla]
MEDLPKRVCDGEGVRTTGQDFHQHQTTGFCSSLAHLIQMRVGLFLLIRAVAISPSREFNQIPGGQNAT